MAQEDAQGTTGISCTLDGQHHAKATPKRQFVMMPLKPKAPAPQMKPAQEASSGTATAPVPSPDCPILTPRCPPPEKRTTFRFLHWSPSQGTSLGKTVRAKGAEEGLDIRVLEMNTAATSKNNIPEALDDLSEQHAMVRDHLVDIFHADVTKHAISADDRLQHLADMEELLVEISSDMVDRVRAAATHRDVPTLATQGDCVAEECAARAVAHCMRLQAVEWERDVNAWRSTTQAREISTAEPKGNEPPKTEPPWRTRLRKMRQARQVTLPASLPRGLETASERRERENAECVGGLRNPNSAVAKNPTLRALGDRLRKTMRQVIGQYPRLIKVATQLGKKGYLGPPQEDIRLVREAFAHEFGLPDVEYPPPKVGKASPLRAELFEEFQTAAKDPEQHLAEWIRHGCPLGIKVPIPDNAVFPSTSVGTTEAKKIETEWQREFTNYESFESQVDLARQEVQRVVGLQYFVEVEDHTALDVPVSAVSRMALLVKTRADGTLKLRLIVDLRRSGVNGITVVPQRVVLPRLKDAVESCLDLGEAEPEPSTDDIEIVIADFADAYCHLRADEREWEYLWGRSDGKWLLYVMLCFGLAGAPLVWCRLAAFLGRIAQALLLPEEGRLQIYIDDPLLLLRGPKEIRDLNIASVLLLWAAMGGQLSWQKASRGNPATWIGASIRWLGRSVEITVPAATMKDLAAEIDEALGKPVVPLQTLRKLGGRNGWATNLLPHARWAISRIFAAIADKDRENAAGNTESAAQTKRQKKASSHRPGGGDMTYLVHASRVRAPLAWMSAFWRGRSGRPLVRTFRRQLSEPKAQVITDASPWGLGGFVLREGIVLSWFSSELTPDDVARFGWQIGEPDGQCTWEALAVLVAIRTFAEHIRDMDCVLRLRSDNVAALRLATKLASGSQKLNALGAHIALALENADVNEVLAEHLAGADNVVADALSRLSLPGYVVPAECSPEARVETPGRGDAFYPLWDACS